MQNKIPANLSAVDVPSNMSKGYLRLPRVLELFPVSKSTWWEMVRDGRAPKPVTLARRCTAWKVEEIIDLIARTGAR